MPRQTQDHISELVRIACLLQVVTLIGTLYPPRELQVSTDQLYSNLHKCPHSIISSHSENAFQRVYCCRIICRLAEFQQDHFKTRDFSLLLQLNLLAELLEALTNHRSKRQKLQAPNHPKTNSTLERLPEFIISTSRSLDTQVPHVAHSDNYASNPQETAGTFGDFFACALINDNSHVTHADLA